LVITSLVSAEKYVSTTGPSVAGVDLLIRVLHSEVCRRGYFNPFCPPVLGDHKKRRGASPLCTPWGHTRRGEFETRRPSMSFPRRWESRCRVGRVLEGRNPPALSGECQVLGLPRLQLRILASQDASSTPFVPHSWGMIKESWGTPPNPRQRGFAPLHAPNGGVGETLLIPSL